MFKKLINLFAIVLILEVRLDYCMDGDKTFGFLQCEENLDDSWDYVEDMYRNGELPDQLMGEDVEIIPKNCDSQFTYQDKNQFSNVIIDNKFEFTLTTQDYTITNFIGLFKCEECGFNQDTMTLIFRHISCAHKGKCPFKKCNKYFGNCGDFMKHFKTHFLEGMEYRCTDSLCKLKYLEWADLVKHLKNHTNNRIYYCNQCYFWDYNHNAFRQHMRNKHNKTMTGKITKN